jgi:hypothetical protein
MALQLVRQQAAGLADSAAPPSSRPLYGVAQILEDLAQDVQCLTSNYSTLQTHLPDFSNRAQMVEQQEPCGRLRSFSRADVAATWAVDGGSPPDHAIGRVMATLLCLP